MSLLALAIIFLLLLPVLLSIRVVNQFARLENLLRESWADVDVALKRRHDLIPNLVETVKGYVDFEEQIVAQVLEARKQAVSGGAAEESELTRSLNTMLIKVEAFPELKASGTFVQLQQELVNSEDRIAAARRFYNANVRTYNTLVQSFPASMISGGRTPKEYYQVEAIETRHVAVTAAP